MKLQFGDTAMIKQIKREEAMGAIVGTVEALIDQYSDILQPGEIGYGIGTGIFFATENNDMGFDVMIKDGISSGLRG